LRPRAIIRIASSFFEGDYGGNIYLTIPVREIACGEAALKQCLFAIDGLASRRGPHLPSVVAGLFDVFF
jgi:hypothetical protein